jgi:cobalt/nickel transport system permease protein
MHIPDGYLSPATCATLYAAAAPFWYTSLQRMKRMLNTRMTPLLSVFAAFSFIIMMFNLPLPGGTTGHAVGVGIAAIVLGPWGSMLAISITLVIQAIFFGDGGITTIGANCFNMAVAGSLVAFAIYRIVSGRTPIDSPRRVVAAAIAGYVSINVAALLAAVEFGIQPLLYRDASGAPLYAPYPLHIAVPAMMIGHLSIAGLAELMISAGVVAYLQRAEPSLLRSTAAGAAACETGAATFAGGWRTTKSLWITLGALMILSPLGILAAGAAWGEWSPQDFVSPQARQQIAAASGNQSPPLRAPAGMQRLSSFWTSPMPRYAPAFIKSAAFGYVLSAIFGTGLIILVFVLTSWLAHRLRPTSAGIEATKSTGAAAG